MNKTEYISLRLLIWGEKLGMPKEDDFILTRIENKDDNIIVLHFLGNIKCTIINPVEMIFKPQNEKRLKIKSADKIIWEGWYYEKQPMPDSPSTIQYTLLNDSSVHVIANSNYKSRNEIMKVKGKIAIRSF